jgi:hypothetical protein
VLAVATARGGATAAELTSGQVDPLVPLLPLLVLPTAGIAVARLSRRCCAGSERAARGTPVHLALLSWRAARTAGRDGRPSCPVALGVALFAPRYRKHAREGRAAQAAFAEPLDVRVTAAQTPSPRSTRPRSRAIAAWRRARPSSPSCERGEPVPTTGSARRSVPVIGVPADALGDLDGLRRALGAPQARALGDRLEPPFAPESDPERPCHPRPRR